MSTPKNPAGPDAEAETNSGAGSTALIVPAASAMPDTADLAVADLPSLHHVEIATARRYADASRAPSTQRAYASD